MVGIPSSYRYRMQVAGRDYLFQNRQGLNSLRHTKSAVPKGGGPHQPSPSVPTTGNGAVPAATRPLQPWQLREAYLVAEIDTLQAELEELRRRHA